MHRLAVLLVERDATLRERMRVLLLREGFTVSAPPDSASLYRTLRRQRPPDLLIVDTSREAASDGLAVVHRCRQGNDQLPVILIATDSSEELAIAALKAGVADYFKPPLSLEEVIGSVHRCLSGRPGGPPAHDAAPRDCTLSNGQRLVGQSPPMQQIKQSLEKVARTGSTVLITGETGTGKELVAALIHQTSPRQQKPFVCINCAAIPDSLLESELFGYERGAFTGAQALKEGRLKFAEGGTIFLDEIGEMSPYAQAKVLRAIESREIQRLGGKGSIPLDFRVITATNQELERLVAEGQFRKDLYFRLNVVRIHVPPLRDRKEDIALLADYYIGEFNRQFGRAVRGFSEEALAALLRYDWPGNVRELKNLVEALFVDRSSDEQISLGDLPEQFRRGVGEAVDCSSGEREQILSALLATNWNRSRAAQKLHWSRVTLYRKMVKHQILSRDDLEQETHF